jgi:hypothetical protein
MDNISEAEGLEMFDEQAGEEEGIEIPLEKRRSIFFEPTNRRRKDYSEPRKARHFFSH